jgi:hypothetical protein
VSPGPGWLSSEFLVARIADAWADEEWHGFQQHMTAAPIVIPRHRRTEVGARLTDSFVTDDDAALGKKVLNVAEAEMKAKVQPDGVADHVWRKAMATVTVNDAALAGGWARRQLIGRQLDNPAPETAACASIGSHLCSPPAALDKSVQRAHGRVTRG